MIITLMRHGKVDGPPGLYGYTDIPCSDSGLKDMALQIQQVSEISQIMSSPRKRCLEFATTLSNERQLPLNIDDDFAELSFGDWDGVAFEAMQDDWQQVEDYFLNPGEITPPGGESLQDFYYRVDTAWRNIIADLKTDNPLIICHGGVIRMILANVMQMDFKAAAWFSNLDIRNASITQIQLTQHQEQNYFRVLQIGSKLATPQY